MAVIDGRVLFAAAVVLFAAASLYSVLLWRRGFSRNDWWCYGLLTASTVPLTGALLSRGFSLQHCPVTNLFEATMFVAWAILLAHVAIGMTARFRFLSAFAAPMLLGLGVFGLQPRLDEPGPVWNGARGLLSLHVTLVLLGYGAFALSAMSAVMYLVQERDLKVHKLRAVLARLPAIERLEKVMVQAAGTGLVLLSLGLALSVVLVRQSESAARAVRGDPKVVWSILVWCVYLGLLVTRGWLNRGPRWLAWSSVGVFVFVMLTFWGTNLLSPLHQQ